VTLRNLAFVSAVLLLLSACNKGGTTDPRRSTEVPGTPGAEAPRATDTSAGRGVFMTNGCAVCHGEQLTGSGTLGPALKGLAVHWKADTLTAYLRDPQGYAMYDARLAEQHGKYSMKMPAMPLDEAKMASLVEYLLAQ
jgi:mono/diheme cytochrome c family protein